jgi:hypothetical protein
MKEDQDVCSVKVLGSSANEFVRLKDSTKKVDSCQLFLGVEDEYGLLQGAPLRSYRDW